MLTFSARTKNELCRAPAGRACCRTAELYGMLLFGAAFSCREIRLVSEQPSIIRRAAMLLNKVCGVSAQPVSVGRRKVIQLTEPNEIAAVMEHMGYDFRSYITYHLNRNVIENDCCAAAFVRGMFLMAGSVAGPDKKSHLEIKTGHAILGREVMSLLLDLELMPKMIERRSTWLLYWKSTAQVEDFLTLIGARHAALAIMEAKVEKQLRGEINRKVNCETANLIKITSASTKQISAIEKALAIGGIEIFPENLRQTVDLRVANPTASLAELAAKFDPPISKPGLSHRLGRIMEIAMHVIDSE